jgi:lysophospholipase L1-like esterase
VQEVNQLGDTHVYYIDTTGWITAKTSEYADRLHPSNKGQRIIARHLAPILSSYLNA